MVAEAGEVAAKFRAFGVKGTDWWADSVANG